MAGQIRFFEKNKADYSFSGVVLTASQGQDYVEYVRNRSNNSYWITTGSVDADNTTFEVDFGEEKTIDNIQLKKHNFKSYTLKYWNGSAWTNFSTTVAPTTNSDASTSHDFNSVTTQKVLLTILGTFVVDDDKYLAQFICTQSIGTFAGWPIIKKPEHDRAASITKMLSGKSSVINNVGSFSCELAVSNLKASADLAIIEELFTSNEGFLVWLNGGVSSQFSSNRIGYRPEDIYLMRMSSPHTPEWYKGLYKSGMVISLKLVEVIT